MSRILYLVACHCFSDAHHDVGVQKDILCETAKTKMLRSSCQQTYRRLPCTYWALFMLHLLQHVRHHNVLLQRRVKIQLKRVRNAGDTNDRGTRGVFLFDIYTKNASSVSLAPLGCLSRELVTEDVHLFDGVTITTIFLLPSSVKTSK